MALLPLRRKTCWGFFRPKIRRLRPGANPRTWVPKVSTLPLDHRSCLKRGLTYVYRDTGASSRNNIWRVEAVDVLNSECVFVALGVQHAKRMCRVLFSSVACLAVPYFSTLSHKECHLRKNVRNIKCVLDFV